MSVYTTPASSRHNSYMRQHSAYSSRQGSSQSGFLSYSANHRNVIPPRPLSLRPISQATSIAVSDSDYDSHGDNVRERGKFSTGPNGWRQNDIKEEDEENGQIIHITEEVSDAESMESLSSRAKHMQGILTDSDSMHSGSRTRTSISSFSASEAATPEQSPLPHYGEPVIYDPDNKNPMMYRHSMSYGEDLPRYTVKENMITTIGPKGPHLFRSLSVCSTVPSAAATRLASTADFIPPTPVTPLDTTEFDIPANLNAVMYDQRRLSLQFSPTSPKAAQQHQSFEMPVQDMERAFNPERDVRPLSTLSAAVLNDYDQLDIMDWTPQQVCQHLGKVGFDRTIVEKFARNDISGQILIDLKWEDLKELDIQSFGKRIEVWSEIHHLRCRSSTGPVEQFATYRPESRMSRTTSHRSARPSPASSRPALTPRTPHAHVETLKPIAFNADIQEEDEEDQPRSISSEDEETTIAVRLVRNPTHRRRVRTKKGTHARISRKRFSSADSGTDAAETTEGEQVYRMHSMREALPTLRETPKRRQNPAPDSICPDDSISVAKRRTCKAHAKCKKGDKCGKHGVGRKQSTRAQQLQSQKMVAGLPQRSSAGTIVIATTPSIAQSMAHEAARGSVVSQTDTTRPGSIVAPSVLASSDVLGPIQSREVKLQEGALREIIAMDPAENVKKFLIHQHLQHLEEQRKEPPPVPQKSNEEIMRALASPGIVMPQEYYEENQAYETEQEDQVPEIASLMLPQGDVSVPAMSPPVNRSKTPALGLRTTSLTPAPPGSVGFSPMSYRARGSMLRTTTPFSEMDVPIGSSTPMIPEFRNQSASVPPDMTYGAGAQGQRGPINRSSFGMPSTAGKLMAPAPPPPGAAGIPPRRSGAQSTTGVRPQVMILDDLEENAEWEDASDKTSIQEIGAQRATGNNDVLNSSIRVHSGWMRKRKTNWFRHEWPEHHFVLRGTRLGIHKDQHSAEDGFIEMEDYSVACSNSASTKLSAAFKSWKIKNGQGNTSDGAFFFQLVPCNDKDKPKRGKGTATGPKEKKVVHHFAVKSRDERIDWMRELMLAKAIKQKGEGFDVEVNGEKI